MVSRFITTETSQGIALRIHGDGDAFVSDISGFLRDLEYAYNSAYVFDSIIEEAEELYRADNVLNIPIRNLLWMTWWPPTPEKVAAMVPQKDRLRLSGVELHSPGFWDFLGKLNPLEVLRQYLNDRHERQKDRAYRSSAEARKLELENQILELDVIERGIDVLIKALATDKDLSLLKEQLLAKSLRQLNPYQDQGLMIEAEIIHPNIEKNKDRVTPATFNKNEVITVDTRGQIISSVPLTVTPITKRIGDKALIHLVEIPSGEFLMGVPEEGEVSNSSERPQHRVKILRFWMGQFLITQQQWQVVSSLPCIERALDNNPSYFKGPNLPVENVSWLDATEFCKRLSQATDTDYRLPSEAEWEYACRAGTTTPFYFGQTITAELANYNGTDSYESGPKNQYREQTTEVGSFPPNAFGLYDMHGNVWEWCQDTWHDNYTGAPTDGSAWTDNDNDSRIIRGGSWYNSPWYCRCVSRLRLNPGYRNFNYGFRVALVAPRTLQ